MMKGEAAGRWTMHAKGMDIGRSEKTPVDELDAKLERSLRAAHHLGFVDADGVVEVLHVRKGRFADPDDTDLIGFDEAHSAAVAGQQRSQPGGGHPAGRATTQDYDIERWLHRRSRCLTHSDL